MLTSRIVVTEDNPADVVLLRTAFSEHEICCDLRVYSDGEEALLFAERAGSEESIPCPDLFMLDLHLPKVDGMEVLSRFRANQNCKSTPVILFSSTASPHVLKQIRLFEGVQFLRKPSDLQDFMDVGRIVKDLLAAK